MSSASKPGRKPLEFSEKADYDLEDPPPKRNRRLNQEKQDLIEDNIQRWKEKYPNLDYNECVAKADKLRDRERRAAKAAGVLLKVLCLLRQILLTPPCELFLRGQFECHAKSR